MSVEIRHQMVVLLPRLRAFARALARTGEAADDLVQATCEKALRSFHLWTPGTRLDSWMFRIMQNEWIDTKRRTRPQVEIDEPAIQPLLAGEDGRRTAEARLTLDQVRTRIERLPEEQRTVLTLICLEDMSYRDAAEILEIPIGTVMSRLGRARSALAKALDGSPNISARASGGHP
jgi:RNA polymerase sigma-70 factor (ECF subfamily)